MSLMSCLLDGMYDRPLYLVCPNILITVDETSYRIRVWFIESHIVFTVYLFIYLCLRCKVYCYPVKQTAAIF